MTDLILCVWMLVITQTWPQKSKCRLTLFFHCIKPTTQVSEELSWPVKSIYIKWTFRGQTSLRWQFLSTREAFYVWKCLGFHFQLILQAALGKRKVTIEWSCVHEEKLRRRETKGLVMITYKGLIAELWLYLSNGPNSGLDFVGWVKIAPEHVTKD